MKNILLKIICVIALTFGTANVSKAQLVHIPDSAFRVYLNQYFGVCMVGDSINSTCPAVLARKYIDVSARGIFDLSGIEVFVNDTLLDCSENQLTTLPNLPTSLNFLDCHDNLLTSLPNLPQLTYFNCLENQLTSLPTLPASLTVLYCSFNQLTSLPTLPASLTVLYSNNNPLTSLPALPSSLTYLFCSSNQLAVLPSLPASLTQLYCYSNQLTSLPELPFSLTNLECSYNPLTCFPSLKNVTTLYFANTLINCLPGYGILQNCVPSFLGYPICDVFNSNGCDVLWNIEGTSFFDSDLNCNISINEPILKNKKLNLYKNGVLDQQTFSNANGDYVFDTFSFDLYKTEFDTTGLPFEAHCPLLGYYIDNISVTDSMKYNRDFGLKCKGADIAVSSIFSSNLRPASVREIKIQAGDLAQFFGANCANGIIGTVLITISGPCNYYSPAVGALTPSSINGNVLTYSIADFGVLSYDSSFNFNILVDTTAALGSQICIQVSISTRSQELNYNNNLLSQCFTIVGSFDPNDKTAFPNSNLDISGDRWLTYLIRFQNTGTASAEHIYITDTLSAALDWSTFNLLSFSHQPLTQVYNDGLVKFNFPHINLPDSNSNEPASHGFVQYKIRAKDSLAIGSTVENTANIFFDFNPPIITNTTNNTVINCSIPPTIINATVCNSLNFELNGVIYSNSGTHVQRFITANGCDSTIHLNLTINSTESYLTDSICDGGFYYFNGQQLTVTGIYYDTLTNIIGCDSIIHLNLQVNTTHYSIHQVTICENESYLFEGIYLSQAGTYLNTLKNVANCDSIIELKLMVEPGIVNILSQESFSLQTTAIGSSYQWINCATNNNIAGATNSTFHPTQSGDYSVAVTYGNCVDTSDCRTIKLISGEVILQTWYNSTSNQIKLKAENLRGNMGAVRLIDISGRIILEKKLDGISSGILNTEISTNGISEGIYIVNLITDRESDSGKVVKY